MSNVTTKIKVVGVGGGGCNAISRMMRCRVEGVDLIAVNTDIQELKKTKAHQKIWIGKEITKGLGTGMNFYLGRKAAERSKEKFVEILKDSDIVFITAGLGGGTGTGASPLLADIAKKIGALTVAVVTLPFSFEGKERMRVAKIGLRQLKERVDTLLVVSNDKILRQVDQNTTLKTAFWNCDEILRQAVQGISDLIVVPGIINVDFADVKSIMKNSGSALFGIGKGVGKKKVEEAVEEAINSPLLDSSIKGAKGILFNISGGENLTLNEVDRVAKKITENASSEAKIIFGAIQNKKLQKDEIRIMVIATGFKKD